LQALASENAKYAKKYDYFTAEALRRRGKTGFVIDVFKKLYAVGFIDETCLYIKNRSSLRLRVSAVNI